MRTIKNRLTRLRVVYLLATLATIIFLNACTNEPPAGNSTAVNVPSPTATASPAATPVATASQLTLPLLDALLRNESFVEQLKSKLQVNESQIEQLKHSASAEIGRLRQSNAEQSGDDAADDRARAHDALVSIVGESKASELTAFADDYWAKNGNEAEGNKAPSSSMPAKPNSIPTDTRVVVNIPAFRMDIFKEGSLVKSYKIGIGYPAFPLPQGLRKAQTIIFNPTWTPPDSPWVANMKDVTAGEVVEAGSSLNPLGPIKIPIGMPSLIHGGKSPAKIGQFASHGCVGLTNAQVKDFAKHLAQTAGTNLTDRDIANYLQDKTRTKVVKLGQTVPVELRYETIVVEDGKLHIYKDVYDKGTNTEENLRGVLEANGTRFEELGESVRTQLLAALNAMSAHPAKALPSPSPAANANDSRVAAKKGKVEKAPKNQKEIVFDTLPLKDKGYPAPVDLDNGSGRPAVTTRVATR